MKYATQLVIAVIKNREYVKAVAKQGGKATFVKAVLYIVFKMKLMLLSKFCVKKKLPIFFFHISYFCVHG